MAGSSLASRALAELGLVSLWRSARDVKLLCLQRFVRLFAYGASTLVLVAYLRLLGISTTRVGLFMTLTLVGDVAISFFLTLFADALGRKAVLALGAFLMALSGLVFARFSNYWVLLAAAIFGVISPNGNEIGPFRAIEESTVAHLTTPAQRSDVYAWYSLLGTAGAAFGMMTCGWVVQVLADDAHGAGWTLLQAYRLVFYAYAVFGLIKLALTVGLSSAVEAESKQKKTKKSTSASPPQAPTPGETTPLLNGGADGADGAAQKPSPGKTGIRALLPEISQESIPIVISICMMLALDSFASSLVSLSWVTFFFRSRYHVEEGKLGSIFFVTNIISALSMLVASSLAKRFGNVNTMVFTHLPSSIFLALIPVPSEVHLSLLFLILRHCTASMDVAPRSAFLASVILPQERTAVMGLINVVKTTAQSVGPIITGVLADRGFFWVSFVAAGSLKAAYDLGLLAVFKHHERTKADQEQVAAEQQAERRQERRADEEDQDQEQLRDEVDEADEVAGRA